MRVFIIICLLFSIGITCVFSQENYRAGTLTQVNVNFSIPRGFKLNTKLEPSENEKESGEETASIEKSTKVSSYTGHMISVFNLLGIGD